MSEQLSFDRAKGFVALPVEILEIDLSPGAFRLLVELCRMANADGYCWPSLDQLSARMGRSKAAISGYVQALRNAELVSTETQKTANGYNYRLKYRVTFWQDWRASLSGTTPRKAERSVQPGERLKKTQKQSHLNQDSGLAEVDLDSLLKNWAQCFKGAPYPLTSKQPSLALLENTKNVLKTTTTESTIISADIKAMLTKLWADLRVETTTESICEQAYMIEELLINQSECAALCLEIRRQWKPHWRRSPTQEQLMKLAKKATRNSRANQLTLLNSYRKRWDLAQNSLRPRPDFGSVAFNKQVAA